MTHETEFREVEKVNHCRDLGTLVTDDLKWSMQCNQAASKAMLVLGMIKRAFGYVSKEIFTSLYSTCQIKHGVLCSSLGSVLSEGYRHTGESSETGYKVD
jgi:hypothetical protein